MEARSQNFEKKSSRNPFMTPDSLILQFIETTYGDQYHCHLRRNKQYWKLANLQYLQFTSGTTK